MPRILPVREPNLKKHLRYILARMLAHITRQAVRALKALEPYIKTDLLYLAKGGFWYTAGQVVSSLSVLALAVAFANLVSQEVYGTYKYILSIAGVFAIFTLPDMSTAVSRTVAQGHENVVRSATKMRIRFSLIGTGVALVGSGYYFLRGNIELSIALLVIAATLPIFDTFTHHIAYAIGKRRFDLAAIWNACTQIVSVLSLVITLFLTDNLIVILLAYFIPLALTRFLFYTRLVRTLPHKINDEAEQDTFSYGKHLTLMNVIATLSSNVDKVLLWKFAGPVQVAVYTFSLAIPEQIKGPLKGIAEMAFPKYASQSADDIGENLGALYRKLAVFAALLLALSAIYIVLAPYMFALLFPQYMESVIYSQIFMLASVGLVGMIPMTILSAHRRIKEQYTMTSLQPILQTIAYVICIPLWGIMGAIIARVVIRAFYLCFSLYLLQRTFGSR